MQKSCPLQWLPNVKKASVKSSLNICYLKGRYNDKMMHKDIVFVYFLHLNSHKNGHYEMWEKYLGKFAFSQQNTEIKLQKFLWDSEKVSLVTLLGAREGSYFRRYFHLQKYGLYAPDNNISEHLTTDLTGRVRRNRFDKLTNCCNNWPR